MYDYSSFISLSQIVQKQAATGFQGFIQSRTHMQEVRLRRIILIVDWLIPDLIFSVDQPGAGARWYAGAHMDV